LTTKKARSERYHSEILSGKNFIGRSSQVPKGYKVRNC
jgi:hypothetical protein